MTLCLYMEKYFSNLQEKLSKKELHACMALSTLWTTAKYGERTARPWGGRFLTDKNQTKIHLTVGWRISRLFHYRYMALLVGSYFLKRQHKTHTKSHTQGEHGYRQKGGKLYISYLKLCLLPVGEPSAKLLSCLQPCHQDSNLLSYSLPHTRGCMA